MIFFFNWSQVKAHISLKDHACWNHMADHINGSLTQSRPLVRSANSRLILVQIFVALFLGINTTLLAVLFLKEIHYTTMRYILFAVTLISDSVILLFSNILLIYSYYDINIQIWSCILFCVLLSIYSFVTPVNLTAMTLERYVAICMPLRHATLCTLRSTVNAILIIHCLSSIPSLVILSLLFASTSLSFYQRYSICSFETLIIHRWQGHLRSAISQFYFLVMLVTIVFSYVKIMRVAKAASGEDRKSSLRGLRTVALHGFQLLLCLIQLWCPFIEMAVLQIDFRLFIDVRFFNYILFMLVPRCLSPLIYGLRDEKFCQSLKHCILGGFHRKQRFQISHVRKWRFIAEIFGQTWSSFLRSGKCNHWVLAYKAFRLINCVTLTKYLANLNFFKDTPGHILLF